MWFTETPWPPMIIAAAGALALFAAWYQNGRRAFLYGGVACVSAAVAIFCFEKWYVTEPEQVEERLRDLIAAIEADDADRALRFFSDDAVEIRKTVKTGMSLVRIDGSVRLTDVQIRYQETGTAILAHFRANGDVVARKSTLVHSHFTTRWELTWKKVGGEWKIVQAERLDPLSGERINVFSAE